MKKRENLSLKVFSFGDNPIHEVETTKPQWNYSKILHGQYFSINALTDTQVICLDVNEYFFL